MTTSSRRLDLAKDAERDVRGILRFTRTAWGERQRAVYAQQIADALEQLTRFPDLGERRDQISAGLRARPVEQHVIYYRITDQAIMVLRVLHVRMDVAAQFES